MYGGGTIPLGEGPGIRSPDSYIHEQHCPTVTFYPKKCLEGLKDIESCGGGSIVSIIQWEPNSMAKVLRACSRVEREGSRQIECWGTDGTDFTASSNDSLPV